MTNHARKSRRDVGSDGGGFSREESTGSSLHYAASTPAPLQGWGICGGGRSSPGVKTPGFIPPPLRGYSRARATDNRPCGLSALGHILSRCNETPNVPTPPISNAQYPMIKGAEAGTDPLVIRDSLFAIPLSPYRKKRSSSQARGENLEGARTTNAFSHTGQLRWSGSRLHAAVTGPG
jgi:hypothetical protein